MSDAQNVFKHLDIDNDGSIGYNEFCHLCEEKRRGIDPFLKELQSRNANTFNSYFTTRDRS